ncbi:MAG: hypothetical protein GX868_07635 [Actinobacteria bacterium]|nr:hypothetical protein [Actinomycetota bacterium]
MAVLVMDTMSKQGEAPAGPEEIILRTGRIGRRAFAYLIDASVLVWAIVVGALITGGIYVMAASTLNACSISRDGDCDPSIWLDRLMLLLVALWTIGCVYGLLVRPTQRSGATLGMRQLGISVVSQIPGRAFSTAQLNTRVVASQPVLWVLVANLVYLGFDSERLTDTLQIVAGVAGLVIIVGSALLILAPGHRSLADALTNTRVIVVRPFSYLAALAAVVVPAPALGVAITLLIGIAGRPDRLDPGVRFGGRNYQDFDWLIDSSEDFFDLAEWFTASTGRWVLLAAVWVICCIASWFALNDTRWRNDRKAGRGLALYAALFTALPVVALLGSGVWALATSLVDSLN